jgi:nucleotide-binding universal stress UspA family protein
MLFGESSRPVVPKVGAEIARQRYEEEKEAAQRHLETTRARLAQAGFRATFRIVEGDPASAILEHADQTAPSLIAMSTHGRGGLRRLILGSVAEEVLRRSPRPLFLLNTSANR